MGLEQTLSDERLELLITSLIMSTAVAQQTQSFAPSFATQNELQVAALRELLAYRKAAGEPVAWESTTTCYVKYVTDKRYQGFSDQAKQWYKPYKCSNCAATQPQAVTVPDEWTDAQCLEFLTVAFRHNRIKGDIEFDDIRLGVKMANDYRPPKSVTNEP